MVDSRLDDILQKILERGHGIIINIDDASLPEKSGAFQRRFHSEYVERRAHAVKRCEEDKGVSLDVITFSLAEAEMLLDSGVDLGKNSDLVMVSSINDPLPVELPGLITASRVARKVREKMPDVPLELYAYGCDKEPLKSTLRLVSDTVGADLAFELMVPINYYDDRTSMHHLGGRLGSVLHEFGAIKDAQFMSYLSESFMSGNSQTATDKTFLVINDKLKKLVDDRRKEKFDVVGLDEDLSKIDFSKYAAILVDNAFDAGVRKGKLGRGISVLENLSGRDLGIPIIYQSAHNMDDFSAKERSIVESLGGILMPKNCAFKLCRGEDIAEKEVYVGTCIAGHRSLASRTARIELIGSAGYVGKDGLFVVSTRSAMGGDGAAKNKVFKDLGIEDDVYSSRMYTLVLFHALLKGLKDEEAFKQNVTEYYYHSDLWKMINDAVENGCEDGPMCASGKMMEIRNDYNRLMDKHKNDKHTVLAHYDAKWDNWFQTESEREDNLPGSVLGDFGNVASGTEYRDVARALLDRETGYKNVKDVAFVEKYLLDYMQLRKYVEKENGCIWAVDEKEFISAVKDHILLESVRIAGFQAKFTNDREKVNALLDVALNYAERIDLNGEYR